MTFKKGNTPHNFGVRRPLNERFWSKVEKTDTCWLWRGGIGTTGYGQFGIAAGDNHMAHRLAWELTYGPIFDGKMVLHHCDVRTCVRPDHLFLGTHADNMDGRMEKGRTARGAHNGFAVLTEAGAANIKHRALAGENGAIIAREYSVNRSTVWKIKHGISWRHV